jgi:hypothetical protein
MPCDGSVGPVEINLTPQETTSTTPLDEDHEHATYEPEQVATYSAAAARAALVLGALRARYRGHSTRSTHGGGRSTSPTIETPISPAMRETALLPLAHALTRDRSAPR